MSALGRVAMALSSGPGGVEGERVSVRVRVSRATPRTAALSQTSEVHTLNSHAIISCVYEAAWLCTMILIVVLRNAQ